MGAHVTAFRAKAYTPEQKLAEAQRLLDAAYENARRAKRYHSRARSQRKEFAELKRDLEAMGVEVVLEPQSPRRQSDHRSGGGADRSGR